VASRFNGVSGLAPIRRPGAHDKVERYPVQRVVGAVRILKVMLPIAVCVTLRLSAQEPPGLAAAKAMDQEIEKLNDLPDERRVRAIKDLVLRIRQQPKMYAVALAYNLAIAATEATERDILQEVTTALVDAVQKSPNEYRNDSQYTMLAKLARYYHMQVSLNDPRYAAEISKLEADDQHRSTADFTLRDVQGQEWSLKMMMIHDARAPEKTVLHLPPMVPSQPTSRITATRLQ
jgi:hypothetical protein